MKLQIHLQGLMHVTGHVREDSHSGQGHQDGSYEVTRYPAGNGSHQHPGAVEHTVQVESHTGEGKQCYHETLEVHKVFI